MIYSFGNKVRQCSPGNSIIADGIFLQSMLPGNRSGVSRLINETYIEAFRIVKEKKSHTIGEEEKKDYDLLVEIPKDFKERQAKNYDSFFDFSVILFPKDFDFIINPLTLQDTNKRKKIFKDKLYQIVNNHHIRFLEEKGVKDYDAFQGKSWYHSFDLENCPDIPIYNIQPKPNNGQVFENAIINSDIKSEIMKNAMDLIYKEEEQTTEEKKKESEEKKGLNKYVSMEFIKKLRAKEKVNKISKEINDFNYKVYSLKNFKELYMEILKQMKTLILLNSKRITGFTLADMVEMLRHSSRQINDAFNESELTTTLIKISKKYPDILQIKMNSDLGRPVVVMNLEAEFPEEIVLD